MTLTSKPFVEYALEEVWLPVSENILAWEQDFHQLMLDDQIRMRAYESAIREAVKPGMIVLDLGTGTGVLGLWALQAGAAHLYAIDVNAAVIPTAIANFERAGFAGKFDVYQGFSYDITLPRPADLVISEIIGNLGDNEDFTPILNDARKRFLKPGGRMLPLAVRSELVPVSSISAHRQVAAKTCRALNANYSLAELMQRLSIQRPFNLYYDCIIPRACYLSEPRTARAFRFDGDDLAVYETQLMFPVTREGMFTGFKGSFVADLSASVALDISGDDLAARTTSDSWKHCYLPIENPIALSNGDEIHLRYSRSYPSRPGSPFRQCYRWAGKVMRSGALVAAFDQSTGGEGRVNTHIDLKQSRDSLRRFVEEKQQMVETIAHDLRNYFANIQFAGDMLRDPDMETAARLRLVESIRTSSDSGVLFLQALLDHQNAQEQGVSVQKLSAGKILNETVEVLSRMANAKNIKVSVTLIEDFIVCGHHGGVLHVMQNLLSNALKFSPPGSEVLLTAVKFGKRGRLSVIDQGPGVSKPDQERLFQRYVRLTATPTDGETSTGLGLALAKQRARTMDGDLWYDDREGGGSVFTLDLGLPRP